MRVVEIPADLKDNIDQINSSIGLKTLILKPEKFFV